MGGPGGGERAAVHVLEFADFARFCRHGGHVAGVVRFDLLGGHDAGDPAEDGGGFEGGSRIVSRGVAISPRHYERYEVPISLCLFHGDANLSFCQSRLSCFR